MVLNKGENRRCASCGICAWVCPRKAIKMVESIDGFRYPQVDYEKCIFCGRCTAVCSAEGNAENNTFQRELFAMKHEDKNVLMQSQSGGAFSVFSDIILQEKGSVYGAVFDSFEVSHSRADNAFQRDKMRGSKYAQSLIRNCIFEKIADDLAAKRDVLFSGTPCQCAAIRKLFDDCDNLYTAEIICHGTPSNKILGEYLKIQKKKIGMNIERVSFDNVMVNGIKSRVEALHLKDGSRLLKNDYVALFYSYLAHKQMCFECPYAREDRFSDITMGDFWDYKYIDEWFDRREWVSMVFVNTVKGHRLLNKIKKENVKIEHMDCEDKTFRQQPRLYAPIQHDAEKYETFWTEYKKYGLEFCINNYATDEIKRKFRLNIIEDYFA